MKRVPKTDAGGNEKLIFNKINSGLVMSRDTVSGPKVDNFW